MIADGKPADLQVYLEPLIEELKQYGIGKMGW